jgi:hypothetical protein
MSTSSRKEAEEVEFAIACVREGTMTAQQALRRLAGGCPDLPFHEEEDAVAAEAAEREVSKMTPISEARPITDCDMPDIEKKVLRVEIKYGLKAMFEADESVTGCKTCAKLRSAIDQAHELGYTITCFVNREDAIEIALLPARER